MHREHFCLRYSTRFSRYQEVERISITESNVPRQRSPADHRMRGQLWKSLPIKMYRKHELSSKFKIKHKSRLKTHWWHGCQCKFNWLKLYYCKRKRFSMGISEVILNNIGVLLRFVLHYSFSANLISHDLVRFPVLDAKCLLWIWDSWGSSEFSLFWLALMIT